jgi:diguanylate cyclase (GGDEF)-like protein/PAS domain S-box-containing protein
MIVEDEGATAMVIQRNLEEMGYSITSVETTAEGAVNKVSIDKPDLVLMDVSLAGEMDGIEAANQIHSISNIPVVYITAHSDEKMVQRIMETEPFGYIIKPFDERDLRIAVEIALYKHGMETKLRESENKFHSLFNNAADSIFLFSPAKADLIIEDLNDTACVMHGYAREELIGKPISLLDNSETGKHISERTKSLMSGKPLFFEGRHVRKDGSTFPVEISARLIHLEGKPYILATDRDITKRKKMEEHLKAISITDELTGLFNRRGFFTLTEKEFKVANRHKRRMSLIYLDLDGLKAINDKLGHETGDQALVDAANILRKSFRESDIMGRMGGDEFAVLITDGSVADIEKIAVDHIQQNLKIHNEQAGRSYALFLSMGFAHYDPGSPCTNSELIKQADSSMYEDKKRHNSKII